MTNSKDYKEDYKDLFLTSVESEGLNNTAAAIMIDNLNATTILGCQGADIDNLNTDDVTLVCFALDMSSSMGNLRQEVIDSFNLMIKAFQDSNQSDSIIVSVWTFNEKSSLLFGYTPVNSVKKLTNSEYQPSGSTSLFDTQLNVMTGIVGYGQSLRNNGIRTKGIVIVLTDGDDNSSLNQPRDVKKVADALIKQEIYTLAFVGFGTATNFSQIAKETGFPTVLTSGNSPSDIRRIFGTMSISVIRSSQTTINTSDSFFSIV